MKSKEMLVFAIGFFALGIYALFNKNAFFLVDFVFSLVGLVFFISDNKK